MKIRIWEVRPSLYSLSSLLKEEGSTAQTKWWCRVPGCMAQSLLGLPQQPHFQTSSQALILANTSSSVCAWINLFATVSPKSNHHDKVCKKAHAAVQPSASLKRKKKSSHWLQEASDLAHSGTASLCFSRDKKYKRYLIIQAWVWSHKVYADFIGLELQRLSVALQSKALLRLGAAVPLPFIWTGWKQNLTHSQLSWNITQSSAQLPTFLKTV